MRYCKTCGEPIDAHTYEPLPALIAREITRRARSPRESRALVRAASRCCPVELVREDNGIPVYRAVRGSAIERKVAA